MALLAAPRVALVLVGPYKAAGGGASVGVVRTRKRKKGRLNECKSALKKKEKNVRIDRRRKCTP